MPETTRRQLLFAGSVFALPPALATLVAGCGPSGDEAPSTTKPETEAPDPDAGGPAPAARSDAMKIHYLEIVTPEVDALCAQYAATQGVTFGEPDAALGGARTAALDGGGMLGIRGPLRDDEGPVVRPYMLVEDIATAVQAAADAGAAVALPSMELPGHGTCAIVIHGGIECGFWQL